jgi:hypothetical protein
MQSIRQAATTLAALLILAVATTGARVKVQVEFDKTFDFKRVRTWSWPADGAGQVKMARTASDNPDEARQRAEPIIINAVTSALTERGLQHTPTAADLTVTYYLLLSTSMSAQTIGQFLPATTAWGLPPFEAATQSLKVMDRGSLVIDLSANNAVVWRGLAQANIDMDLDAKRREALLREAVRDLLRRYPRQR